MIDRPGVDVVSVPANTIFSFILFHCYCPEKVQIKPRVNSNVSIIINTENTETNKAKKTQKYTNLTHLLHGLFLHGRTILRFLSILWFVNRSRLSMNRCVFIV